MAHRAQSPGNMAMRLSNGYIARPGKPMKQFNGWWYGGPPKFLYPAVGSAFGVAGAPQGGAGEGQVAPPAP
jgi:hypothetical protein